MQSQETNNSEVKVHTPDLAKDKKKKQKLLTVTLFVGGKQVDTLTPEQRERMAQRLSERMSIYYTAHLDEFLKIKD